MPAQKTVQIHKKSETLNRNNNNNNNNNSKEIKSKN
jgi:hypothetical protein